MKRRIAIVAGRRIEVSWSETDTTVEATVDGRTYQLEKRRLRADAVWLGRLGASVEALITPRDAGYEVAIRGHRVFVEFEDSQRKLARHGGAAEGLVSVRAPMPGKVVRVLQSQDAEVEAQQGIVVMEAMKMQNEIRSPKRGRIVQLNVAEGDAVKLGDLIAQVE